MKPLSDAKWLKTSNAYYTICAAKNHTVITMNLQRKNIHIIRLDLAPDEYWKQLFMLVDKYEWLLVQIKRDPYFFALYNAKIAELQIAEKS